MNIYNNIGEVITAGNITANSLVNADCLEAMKYIKDKTIDLILCDLPYGTTKASFDSQINLVQLWEQYKRIIKDNGAILLFAQTPFDKLLGSSNLEMLKYEWIWEKTQATGFLNAKKMPMKSHENILVYYKKLPTYNPQKTFGHKPINSYTKLARVQNKTELYGSVNKDVSGGGETDRYPRSVLIFPSDKQTNKLNGFLHPMQKPLALCEYFVNTYTKEGDLVLDNCSGSGTTGLAAKNLKRNFILIEKEKRFHEMSLKRLQIIVPSSEPISNITI
jgi:site-specific DNA-methyltransferase (adenine-specific)